MLLLILLYVLPQKMSLKRPMVDFFSTDFTFGLHLVLLAHVGAHLELIDALAADLAPCHYGFVVVFVNVCLQRASGEVFFTDLALVSLS